MIGGLVVERGRIASLFHSSGPAAIASGDSPADSAAIKVAVLPFENLGDSADAYFADGMTDAVRGKLTSIHSLEVIARSSSEEYRGTHKTARQIGSELGVRYLLTGTVRWAKQPDGTSRVQGSPELVELVDGTARSLWQQPFNAPLTDVFKVQSDIAGQVARALDVALGTSDRQQLAERPTQDLAAYDDYLKGTAIQGLDLLSLKRAAGFYARAVARDSTFGLAWARLASYRGLMYASGIGITSEAPIDSALAKAQQYAPQDVETYRARFVFYSSVAKDLQAARSVLQDGLARYPDNPDLLRTLGVVQVALGQVEQGKATMRRSLELDPRSVRTMRSLADNLQAMHRWTESVEMYRRALAVLPGDMTSLNGAMSAMAGAGDLSGARALIANTAPTVDRMRFFAYTATYGDLYRLLTKEQQDSLLAAPASVERGIAMASKSRGDKTLLYDKNVLARIYILAGDQGKALDLIEPLLSDQYSLSPSWLRIDPMFAPLRGNPRFDRLVKAGG